MQEPHDYPNIGTENQVVTTQTTTESNNNSKDEFVEYSYRWCVVALMAFSFLVNGLANNAVIPITTKLSQTYNLSDTYVDSPIVISYLVYSLMNFPANHLIDSKGLRFSLITGTCLYAVGLFLFSLCSRLGFHWVLIGAVIVALGQPFVINCPAKVAAIWFRAQNRPFATALMTALNILATMIGYVLPTLVVKEKSTGKQAEQQVTELYFSYFLVGFACFVAQLLLMREKPPTPPSKGAEQAKTSVMQSFRIIKNDPNLAKFFLAYIIVYGNLLSFGGVSNQLFKPFGFLDIQIALLGLCLIASGIVGSIYFSLYLKKTLDYQGVIRKLPAYSLGLMVANLLMLIYVGSYFWIMLLTVCLGFMLTPIVPVSYELGCELAFPVGQAQVIGILNGGSMILTFFQTLILSSAIGFGTRSQSETIWFIFILFLLVGTFLFSKIDIKLKRHEFEANAAQTQQQQQQDKPELELQSNNMEKDKYNALNQQK